MPNEKDSGDGTTDANETAKERTPAVEDKPAEATEQVRTKVRKPASKIKRWVN